MGLGNKVNEFSDNDLANEGGGADGDSHDEGYGFGLVACSICLDASRRTLYASLTSINAALFHHLTPAAARVSDLAASGSSDIKPSFALPTMQNHFGVKASNFIFNLDHRNSDRRWCLLPVCDI